MVYKTSKSSLQYPTPNKSSLQVSRTFPNCITNWETRVQTHKPMGHISHSNYIFFLLLPVTFQLQILNLITMINSFFSPVNFWIWPHRKQGTTRGVFISWKHKLMLSGKQIKAAMFFWSHPGHHRIAALISLQGAKRGQETFYSSSSYSGVKLLASLDSWEIMRLSWVPLQSQPLGYFIY